MSNGKLKPQFNRVRTSVALQANSMWTNTIGLDQDPQAGSNSAIEASISAPMYGGGGRREARRERAAQLIADAGVQPAVTSFQGLMELARQQTGSDNSNRGACKMCGGLGHLTKQCRNFLPSSDADPKAADAAAAASGAARPLLAADADDLSSLSDLLSSSSSSSSDDDSRGKKGRTHKRKRSSKDKKEKKSKKKHKKEHKKSRKKEH